MSLIDSRGYSNRGLRVEQRIGCPNGQGPAQRRAGHSRDVRLRSEAVTQDIQYVHHITLRVRDQERSRSFYSDVLGFDDALFEGPLTVRDDCVVIGRPGDFSVAIWPKGFTAERDESARVVVRDERGDVVAIEGEAFDMGGGYVAEFRPEDKVEPRAQQLRRVEQGLGYPIPERCLGNDVYGVWSVGETHPLA